MIYLIIGVLLGGVVSYFYCTFKYKKKLYIDFEDHEGIHQRNLQIIINNLLMICESYMLEKYYYFIVNDTIECAKCNSLSFSSYMGNSLKIDIPNIAIGDVEIIFKTKEEAKQYLVDKKLKQIDSLLK